MNQSKPDLFSCDLKYLMKQESPRKKSGRNSHSHWLASIFIATSVIVWIGSEPSASISVESDPSASLLIQTTALSDALRPQASDLQSDLESAFPDNLADQVIESEPESEDTNSVFVDAAPINPAPAQSDLIPLVLGIETGFEHLESDIELFHIDSELQLDLGDVEAIPDWITVDIKSGQTLSSIFKRYGVDPQHTHNLSRSKHGKVLNRLRTGANLKLLFEDHQLASLRYNINATEILVAHVEPDGYATSIEKRAIEIREKSVSGEIRGSLFRSASKAGLSDQFVLHLVSIFKWNIDFNRDLQPGDRFSVIFEEKFVEDKKIATGSILAAAFTVGGKRHSAIRHISEDDSINYYDAEGQSLKRAFLRSPVKFSRISSGFKKRFHPILKTWKQHKGVDYAARTGTPVMATADGVVQKRGRNGGYGKSIVLKHGRSYSTLYAHLSKYAKKIKVGSRVRQGQVIGYVGSTGMATGSHLHYEFRIGGVHKNPLSVDVPRALAVDGKERKRFMATAAQFDQRLKSI